MRGNGDKVGNGPRILYCVRENMNHFVPLHRVWPWKMESLMHAIVSVVDADAKLVSAGCCSEAYIYWSIRLGVWR